MIGFYGGEPLLNFSLIRNIVEYCETMKHKIHFGYTITINAVILDKYADYLVKNNFLIVISLDGNERNHSYRIDRDGINSFNSVISNVDLLRNKYPDYFDKNVTFNAVLHDRNMVEEINNYIFQRYGKNPSTYRDAYQFLINYTLYSYKTYNHLLY